MQQGTKAHLFVDGFQYNCSDHFLKCIFSATENSIIYKPKKPYRALENFFKIAIFCLNKAIKDTTGLNVTPLCTYFYNCASFS